MSLRDAIVLWRKRGRPEDVKTLAEIDGWGDALKAKARTLLGEA